MWSTCSICLGFSLVLSFVSTITRAEEISLEDVFSMPLDQLTQTHVTTVSRQKEPYLTAPGTVYVLSEEYLDLFGYGLLQDALQTVPSLNLYNPQSPLAGGQRGALSNLSQTKILINGHEVNNLVAQEALLSRQFSTHNIDRVEVMASPGSVLYGANALSGVINIITRDAQPDYEGFDIAVDFGSYNTKSLDGSFGYAFNEDIRLSGSMHVYDSDEEDFDNFVNSADFQSVWVDRELVPTINYQNPIKAQTYSLQLDLKELQIGYFDYSYKRGTGQQTLTWSYDDGEDNRRFQLVYANYQHKLNENLSIQAKLEYTKSRFWGRYYNAAWPNIGNQTDDSVEILPFSNSGSGVSFAQHLIDIGAIEEGNITDNDINTYFRRIYTNKSTKGSKRNALDIQLDWDINLKSKLIFGIAKENTDYVGLATLNAGVDIGATFEVPLDASKNKPVFNSENTALFGQYRYMLADDKLWVHLGARYDSHNNYGSNTSPRISLVWRPKEQRIFKAIYGEAFSAPNVFDLSSDPDKNASTLSAYELTYSEFFNENNWLQLAFYHNQIRDFLGAPPSLIGTEKAAIDSETVKGLELHFEGRKNNWNYHLNGSWILDTEQETDLGRQGILGLPDIQANLGFSYSFNRHYQMGLVYFYTQKYIALHGNTDISDTITIPTSHTVDAILSLNNLYFDSWDCKLSLKISNLMDRKNFQANVRRSGTSHFQQSGRHLMLHFELSL